MLGLPGSSRALPGFAFGFAIMGLFWHGHVRWRRYRDDGDGRSVLLTFLLVFLALIYVFPLAAMANSLIEVSLGTGPGFRGSIGRLFVIYGVGFTAISASMTALFIDARRNEALTLPMATALRDETIVWALLAGAGLASTLLALAGGAAARAAPWVYALLPIAVGLLSARRGWR